MSSHDTKGIMNLKLVPAISKRSTEEIILMLLGGLSIPSIFPFGVIRMMQHNWLLAAVDMGIVLGMVAVLVFVWVTGRVRLGSVVITVFYSIGMLASIYVKGQPIVYWVYPTMIAAFFMLKASEALAINSVSLLLLVLILMTKMTTLDLSSVVITLVLINLFSYIFSHRTSLQHLELNHQAEVDFLTGVGNRRAFDRLLTDLYQPNNHHVRACLFVLDLDHFKNVNDQFGHAVGDQVLIKFCGLIRSRIRAIDSLFRFGGEEFVIVAIGANVDAVSTLAEELRTLVANTAFIPGYPVTVSIGIAQRSRSDSGETWFQRADAMLYEAKQSGRNTVRMAA